MTADGFNTKARIMRDDRGFLEIKDINKVIKAATNDRDKLLLLTLANTGRRISEALYIKPEDINYNEEQIYWKIGKRKDVKRLWIRAARNILLAYKEYINKHNIRPNEFIFKSSHKPTQPINRRRADQIIKAIGKRAGIIKVGTGLLHCHTFRHSFAVYMARRMKTPADLKKLQMLMGHAKIETTAYYLQFAQKDLEDLVNTLPDFQQFGLSDDEIKQRLQNEPVTNELDITSISQELENDL